MVKPFCSKLLTNEATPDEVRLAAAVVYLAVGTYTAYIVEKMLREI